MPNDNQFELTLHEGDIRDPKIYDLDYLEELQEEFFYTVKNALDEAQESVEKKDIGCFWSRLYNDEELTWTMGDLMKLQIEIARRVKEAETK